MWSSRDLSNRNNDYIAVRYDLWRWDNYHHPFALFLLSHPRHRLSFSSRVTGFSFIWICFTLCSGAYICIYVYHFGSIYYRTELTLGVLCVNGNIVLTRLSFCLIISCLFVQMVRPIQQSYHYPVLTWSNKFYFSRLDILWFQHDSIIFLIWNQLKSE